MTKTINRAPQSVSQLQYSDLGIKYFNYGQWKGLNEDKNYVGVDQSTFADCDNVMISGDGVLRSRPAMKLYYDERLNIVTDVWTFDIITAYKTIGSEGQPQLVFYKDGYYSAPVNVPNDFTLVLADRKLFMFAVNRIAYLDLTSWTIKDELVKVDWYDSSDEDITKANKAKDTVYVPATTIVVDDVTTDGESKNLLTTRERRAYAYDAVEDIQDSLFNNNDVIINVDDETYNLRYDSTVKFVLVSKCYEGATEILSADRMICQERDGKLIAIYWDDTNSFYYSVDLRSFNYFGQHHFIKTPKFSTDNNILCILDIVDDKLNVYVKSILTAEAGGIYKYPVWTKFFNDVDLNTNSEHKYLDSFLELVDFLINDDDRGTLWYPSGVYYYFLDVPDITRFSGPYFCQIRCQKKDSTIKEVYTEDVQYVPQVSGTNTFGEPDWGISISDTYTNLSYTNFFEGKDIQVGGLIMRLEEGDVSRDTNKWCIGINAPDLVFRLDRRANPNTISGTMSRAPRISHMIYNDADKKHIYVIKDVALSGPLTLTNTVEDNEAALRFEYTYQLDKSVIISGANIIKYTVNVEVYDSTIHIVTQLKVGKMQFKIQSKVIPQYTGIYNIINTADRGHTALVHHGDYKLMRLDWVAMAGDNFVPTVVNDQTLLGLLHDMGTSFTYFKSMTKFYVNQGGRFDQKGKLYRFTYDYAHNSLTYDNKEYDTDKPGEFEVYDVDEVNILTGSTFYKNDTAIKLLDDTVVTPLFVGASSFAYTKVVNGVTQIFTNNAFRSPIKISTVTDGDIQIPKISAFTELNRYFLATGNNLYVSGQGADLSSGEFKWYFPDLNKEPFDYSITALHPISTTDVAIFFEHGIWYCTWENDVPYYFKSRIPLGCKAGSSVITTYDGKYTVFSTERGLVSMSYQDFISSTEQALTFLSDDILDNYLDWTKTDNVDSISAVQLFAYQFWLIVYRKDSKKAFVFDLRNNSWWPISIKMSKSSVASSVQSTNIKLYMLDGQLFAVHNIHRYFFDTTSVDYYDIEDYSSDLGKNVTQQIDWYMMSQKIHFAEYYYRGERLINYDTLQYFKKVQGIRFDAVSESSDMTSFNIDCITYNNKLKMQATKSMTYEIDFVGSLFKKMNYLKLQEFQFILSSIDKFVRQPLMLTNIAIKYSITGQVK